MKLEILIEFEGDSEEELVGDARAFMGLVLNQAFFDRLAKNKKSGIEVTGLEQPPGKVPQSKRVRAEIKEDA